MSQKPRPGLLATARRRGIAVLMRAFQGVTDQGKAMRATQFAALELPPGRLVFLGDSITQGGEWAEWFPDAPVVNRGIAGDVTADVPARLDTAVSAPRAVFLLIGTNDLSRGMPAPRIAGNVRSILAGIDQRAPGTRVFLQSVMPRTADYAEDLRALNDAYRRLAAGAGAHVEYLDLWPALAAPDGTLRAEFTLDHIHLTGAGYRAWVDVLRPLVDSV